MTPIPATRFGRLYSPDPRDRHYLLTKPLSAILRTSRTWQTPHVVQDQGDKPYCVGYSGYHFLASAPYMERVGRNLPTPTALYNLAQKNDEWPGEGYDGSSVRGLMKGLQSTGLIEGYLWAPDGDTMRAHVLVRGPLNMGTDWYSGMSDPHWVRGSAWLEVSGTNQGGHAWLVVGYSRAHDAYRMLNSWGDSWGERGKAWIDRAALEHLVFGANGEAASAIEKKS